MNSLEKIIKLAKQEEGKFFVVDEFGDPQLVVMSIDEYNALKNKPSYSLLADRLEELSEQTELLNKKILDVQKEEADEEQVDFELPARAEELEAENLYIEPIEE